MTITLYKAAADVVALLDQVDPETGEIGEGLEGAREIVAKKSEAVAGYILQTERIADMIAEHAKELAGKAKTMQKRADKLREYMQVHMKQSGIFKIDAADGTFSAKLELERDSSVEIFDEGMLPLDAFKLVPASTVIDKKDIGDRIKKGKEVPGARVVKKDRLTIKM